MAENFNFSRLRAENQLIFLNTGKIIGIQNVSIAETFGNQFLNYIGIGSHPINNIVNSEQFADVTIGSFLIDQDNFINLTGSEPFNMYILKDKNNLNENYCLISGYLNSYSAKYSLGQPTQLNVGMKFYNNVGKCFTGDLSNNVFNQLINIKNNYYDTGNLYLISNGNSIDLSINEYLNNRILDLSINLNVNRIPIYNVGNKFPKRVDIIYPIEVSCNFTLEIGTYSGTQLRDIPQTKQLQNIQIIANDYNGNGRISMYNFSGMELTNETYGIDVDGNATVTKQFVGKIFN